MVRMWNDDGDSWSVKRTSFLYMPPQRLRQRQKCRQGKRPDEQCRCLSREGWHVSEWCSVLVCFTK